MRSEFVSGKGWQTGSVYVFIDSTATDTVGLFSRHLSLFRFNIIVLSVCPSNFSLAEDRQGGYFLFSKLSRVFLERRGKERGRT